MQFVCTSRIDNLAHQLRCINNICMHVQLHRNHIITWGFLNTLWPTPIKSHAYRNVAFLVCLFGQWSRTCYQCSWLPCTFFFIAEVRMVSILFLDLPLAWCLQSASQGKAAVQAERRRKEELEEDLIALQNEAKAIHDDPGWHVCMAFLPCSPPFNPKSSNITGCLQMGFRPANALMDPDLNWSEGGTRDKMR